MTFAGSMHGVAVDAGSGLEASLRAARGERADPGDLFAFKRAVLEVLGPDASTVLVDATLGPQLLGSYPPGCAPMMAYEADAYRISSEDRITVLPENLSVADFPAMGVRQLKFFLWYAPDGAPALNARKEALVQSLGAECRAFGVSFMMEPLVYDRAAAPGTADFAARKPDLVRRAVATFAEPRFGVDILKVEVPVDLAFVEGTGQPQRSRREAAEAFRQAARPAAERGVPLVYLSAGVPFNRFEASLVMAREAGVRFAGFMCGRAIWTDAIGVFGRDGEAAMRDWLADEGRTRLLRLVAALG